MPVVLCCHQLPRTSHQVQTDNLSAIECLLEGFMRRLRGSHFYSPAHHAVFLCLHGSHVTDHLSRRLELRYYQLLV